MIIKESFECGYCGGPIDPKNSEAHILSCHRHPSFRYRVALECLLSRIEELRVPALGPVPQEPGDQLRQAVEEARLIAFETRRRRGMGKEMASSIPQ